MTELILRSLGCFSFAAKDNLQKALYAAEITFPGEGMTGEIPQNSLALWLTIGGKYCNIIEATLVKLMVMH